MADRAPNCLQCEHYYVTWDLSFPRGCKMFGIKAVQFPAVEVKKNTGRDCPSFVKSKRIRD
ncbi:MAG: hypothetical protein JXR86_14190 [Spirochaetales bacterium]|nr:hypothetical protein [Spirochaetales bacterium]